MHPFSEFQWKSRGGGLLFPQHILVEEISCGYHRKDDGDEECGETGDAVRCIIVEVGRVSIEEQFQRSQPGDFLPGDGFYPFRIHEIVERDVRCTLIDGGVVVPHGNVSAVELQMIITTSCYINNGNNISITVIESKF